LAAALALGCSDSGSSTDAATDPVEPEPSAPGALPDDDAAADDDDGALEPAAPTDDDARPEPSAAADDDDVSEPVQTPTGGNVPEEPAERDGDVIGRFTVTLTQETADYATFDGRVYEAPVPARKDWETTLEVNDCLLREPRQPQCTEECAAPSYCAANSNRCEQEPPTLSVGEVTVTGLVSSGMQASFTLEPLNPTTNQYNASGDAALVFPPFEPGDPVVLEAAGGALEPFAMGAYGIAPLQLASDDAVPFTGEGDVTLGWDASPLSHAVIEISVDISYHGGTKGEIVCSTEDDGELTIDQSLVQGLIDLGVAGFPHAQVTRRSGSFANVQGNHVELNIVSRLTQELDVPGVMSCTDDDQCADGQICQDDSTCG
jgi:hypothetical protein